MNRFKLISLTITDSCNLNCSYCYQSESAHKSNRHMTFDTAKDILLKYFKDDRYDSFEIDFFGGEPLINKKLIIKLVTWALEQNFNKSFFFFISTNGTLLDDEFKKWLIQNKEYISLGLSLDGTPKTHNINRDGSYDKIDIDFFLKMYPSQPVRMTISSTTIENLFENITYLHNLGFKVDASYDQDIFIEKAKNKELISELKKLCDFYISNPDIEPCSLLNKSLPDIKIAKNNMHRWCGAGVTMVSIDTDGKEYPCQAFLPNTMNQELDNYKNSIKEIVKDGNNLKDKECEECLIEAICPTCYGMNYVRSGDIRTRDKTICDIQKITALAITYLLGKRILNNQIVLDDIRLKDTLKSINLIQTEYTQFN